MKRSEKTDPEHVVFLVIGTESQSELAVDGPVIAVVDKVD